MIRIAAVWGGLLLGILCLQIGNGLQSTMVGLWADRAGFAPFATGLVMSSFYAGYFLGPLVAPALVARAGPKGAIVGLAALAAAAVTFYPAWVDPVAWAAVRFVIGFSLSGLYAAAEAWLNERSPNSERGRLFGLYILAQLLGLALGQLAVPLAPPGAPVLVALVTLLITACVLALAFLRAPDIGLVPPRPMSLAALLRASPVGVAGAGVAGFLWAAVMGGWPVYGPAAALTGSETSYLIAAAISGGLVMQLPASWLSDAFDRRGVVLVLALGATASAAWAGLVAATFAALLIPAALLGALTFPLYAVAAAHTSDHLDPAQRLSASASIVLAFGLGSLFGPALAAQAIALAGPAAFFWLIAAATSGLALFTLVRMMLRAAPPHAPGPPVAPH